MSAENHTTVSQGPIVSFDDEELILVNEKDEILGYDTKVNCHLGSGQLHRAFSVFLFDDKGRLLLQQRSSQKALWPLIWSNSCCSHPRRNEAMDAAARRRTAEELGIESELRYLFKFQYQARFDDKGSEHELCSVFVGRCYESPTVNPNEIEAWRFVEIQELEADMQNRPEIYSPWMKIEWKRLRDEHWETIQGLWSLESY